LRLSEGKISGLGCIVQTICYRKRQSKNGGHSVYRSVVLSLKRSCSADSFIWLSFPYGHIGYGQHCFYLRCSLFLHCRCSGVLVNLMDILDQCFPLLFRFPGWKYLFCGYGPCCHQYHKSVHIAEFFKSMMNDCSLSEHLCILKKR